MRLKLIQARCFLACLLMYGLYSCDEQGIVVHNDNEASIDCMPVWLVSNDPVRDDGKMDMISDGSINVLFLMSENGEMFLERGAMTNGDRIKVGKGETGLFRTIVYVSGYYPRSIRTVFRQVWLVNGERSIVVQLLACEDPMHADALDQGFDLLLTQSQFEIGPEITLRPINQGWSLNADSLWRSCGYCSWRRPLEGQPNVPDELFSLWGTRVGSIVCIGGHNNRGNRRPSTPVNPSF